MSSKIIWIASYPKSGNTMVRIFLSCYFFTKTGELKDFNILKNMPSFNSNSNFSLLKNFPKIEYFKKNPEDISKYWLENQTKITETIKENIIFYKTHNAQITYKSNAFTNDKITKCFIYIVRDPRSVVLSSIDHYGFDNQKSATEQIISDKRLTYANLESKQLPEFLLSWKSHYLSWQNFKARHQDKGIILRYEDLVNKPKEIYWTLLNFLCEKINEKIDYNKFLKCLESVKFENLKELEIKKGFYEKSQKSKFFFRKGKTKEWEKNLDQNLNKIILDNFKKEMVYLNYI
tara:strand:- start:271 stop:1140 length:870 start_codon:yes stop_codon:yes gene_type:complete